jgi:glycosyltransferase involved in cell wall biosynthesis
LQNEKINAISYIGNMGYKRNEQIVAIGKALKALDLKDKPDCIDVYSAESRPEILADLTEENGIRFHGSIPADKVLEVMGSSAAVIHTESFDENTRRMVAYSVSTKIADSLASGTCIFSYGPAEIASIEYLVENKAAFCATDERELTSVLTEMLTNSEKRQEIIANAINLAKKNHDSEKNCGMVAETLKEVCGK